MAVGSAIHSALKFTLGETLHVEIYTERLYIRSVKETDKRAYKALFCNEEIANRFFKGSPIDEAKVETSINSWISRWKERDPFSGMFVFNKSTQEFVGYILLISGQEPGECQLIYRTTPPYWKDGYEEEMVKSVVGEFVVELVKRNYKIKSCPLQSVIAAVERTNQISISVLEKLGMNRIPQPENQPFLEYTMRI